MKSLLLYLAGFATPFALWSCFVAYGAAIDWRASRRYQRAWDKFSKEFDGLTPSALAMHQSQWSREPWQYAHYSDDRARYFHTRWQHGNTEEV